MLRRVIYCFLPLYNNLIIFNNLKFIFNNLNNILYVSQMREREREREREKERERRSQLSQLCHIITIMHHNYAMQDFDLKIV